MSNKETNNKQGFGNVSRREFLKDAGMVVGGVVAVSALPGCITPKQAANSALVAKWDYEADVVVIGSGACGMPAAIRARDAGSSVIVVDANYDIGGHAITSGGNTPLGGGTSLQKKLGIVDSPDILFKDLTDWSIVEVNGMPEYRYNDRGVMRTHADNAAATFEFLTANGVKWTDIVDNSGAHASGLSAPRETHPTGYAQGQGAISPAGATGGCSLMRPLEDSARKKGVQFLLNYHMDVVVRETPTSGRVLGVQAHYTPRIPPGSTKRLESLNSTGNVNETRPTVNIRAKKAVIIGTGGHTGNVNFRRIFDTRMTEEVPLAGMPYSNQDASGTRAAMAIGASIWGTASEAHERNGFFRKRDVIGAQYTYISWTPDSPVFPWARASGLSVGSAGWENIICVDQMGNRFYNEMMAGWPNGSHQGYVGTTYPTPYVRGSYLNAEDWGKGNINYKKDNYGDAERAPNEGSVAPDFAAGPKWAIFDADAVTRLKFTNLGSPVTDPEYFFNGTTIAQLAQNIKGPYTKIPMNADTLQATVARYNSFVDTGVDADFRKPKPKYKIQTPPFYAAYAVPNIHDSYAGLRINMKCQVQDMDGQVIPGLYCGGEEAGGSSMHGLGRCTTQGYIAGGEAAKETAV